MTLGNTSDTQERESAPGFDFLLSSTPGTREGMPGVSAPQAFGFTDRPRAELRRGSRVDTRSLAVPVVITTVIVLFIAAAGFIGWSMVQSSEAQVRADSAPMCASLAETPGVLQTPAFGWPTEVTDLDTTLEAITAYQARWEQLSAIAPPTMKPEAAAVSEAAGLIANGIRESKTIDRQASLVQMQIVTSATVIPAWVEQYCS